MNLSSILRELNPLHDLSDHTYDAQWQETQLILLRCAKSLMRGGVAGAAFGSLVTLTTGDHSIDDIVNGAKLGLGLGAGFDYCQYGSRYLVMRVYETIKRNFK